ncbi:heavy metal translocating P-type ATPase [Marinomonas ostreistagni]|uniref:Cadmium-translocating P-type ATPase n=1 Tax=Marinomonas ostreistagni TaxID=359209 RepID=A0ABS0Z775_9GAMM|nr:heavy metal translocating P-type ATPase [Marinomonas ostreistagni]MBJ7549502.1 cadmium-translocating P-type ATPase [Marinomonas ostreistagni]
MNKLCFHCGDPIPTDLHIHSQLQNETREFCCYGCQAIAEHICGADLALYYERREMDLAKRATSDSSAIFDLLKDPSLYNEYVFQESNLHSIQLSISGITCSACAWLIEKHLANQVGVVSISVNVSESLASLTWDSNETDIHILAQAFQTIGYSAQPHRHGEQDLVQKNERKKAIIRLGIAGVGMMQVMMSAIAMYAGDLQGMEDAYRHLLRWISFLFATPVVIYAGLPFYKGAIRDIKTRHFTMDLPVSLGVLLSYGSSVLAFYTESGHVYFDSATMFIFFLLLGRFLETLARSNQNSQQTKHSLEPVKVIRDGIETTVPTQKLAVGDIAIINPGQTIPVDGTLLSELTNVDESSLTGEYSPVEKNKGDALHAQTVNVDQKIQLRVKQVGQNTQAATISRITERALSEKPRVAIIADTVAHYFVLAVLLTATITYGFWTVMGEAEAYWIMVSVLVVTCPCALSLATPVALTAMTNTLKRHGLLITRGHVIESLAQTKQIVFDKTGTLTQGKFSIINQKNFSNEHSADVILSIMSGLEQNSQHPIAQAFRPIQPAAVLEIQNITSLGVSGFFNGKEFFFGNLALMTKIGLQQDAALHVENGKLALFLACEQQLISVIYLSDVLRPEAESVLRTLRKNGIRLSLLTGDTRSSALSTLPVSWFDDYETDCLPDQKWQWLKQQGQTEVLMVGDGLNDVPALAGATTSLAMGASSDLAKLHSDAVLLNNHLRTIPEAIEGAKQCRRIIKQNLCWAAGYNATLLPLAVAGLIPPWVAAIGMALSSLIVVLNASRLNTL